MAVEQEGEPEWLPAAHHQVLPAEAQGLMGHVVEAGLKVDVLQVALVSANAWRHAGSNQHKFQTEGREPTHLQARKSRIRMYDDMI